MENTKEKILEVATNLFLEKGYKQTRISDIINGLDGLTKGAIYHHFESKEDIFEAVVKNIGLKNTLIFDKIKFADNMTGSEKITELISLGLDNDNLETITTISPNLLDSPKLFVSFLNSFVASINNTLFSVLFLARTKIQVAIEVPKNRLSGS